MDEGEGEAQLAIDDVFALGERDEIGNVYFVVG